MVLRLKRLLIGSPLDTAALHEQRLSKRAALAVLASDNLSSAAYATEEILLALTAGAAVGVMVPLYYAIPVGLAIALLTLIVAISYGQTLHAYPTGGGAYTVAKENLGITAALVAGSALLLDYVLTVAVSITAGVAAITSAVPTLYPHRVMLCLLAVAVILLANLRGVRESAAVFAGPVYLFIGSAYLLIVGGLVRYFVVGPPAVPPPPAGGFTAWDAAVLFVLLHAFASGCAALTGIEAVANGVRIFRPPVSRNAAQTLFIMAGLLGTIFVGITVLAYLYGVTPQEGQTVLSQLGRMVFGAGPIYYVIQAATMAILVLAANTSFADFPRLSSVMAEDRFLPRQLASLGDRLVFSNGIVILGAAAALLMILFDAQVHRLIPLYMVGVFTAITLSQAGMVVHWRHATEPGRGWRIVINAVGAVVTAVVLLVVAAVKFRHGAWLVLLAIPLLVVLCRRIRQHYYVVAREMSLTEYEKPQVLRHTVVVPVAGLNRVALTAIEYARSISQDVVAVMVDLTGQDEEKLQEQWQAWAPEVPLVVLQSPYRAIQRPLLRFIDEVEQWRGEGIITVVIPEFIPRRWWHQFLHNQTSLLLKAALLFKPRVIVISVPHHLRR